MIDNKNRAAIQEAMRAAFPTAEERVAQFYGMQQYHLGWLDLDLQPSNLDPGKLLRPHLTLLACTAVGGEIVQALPLAAGIQLIHDFSLIHDDIEDNSATRRGRTTVWKHWGVAQGINTGDGLFVVAHLAVHRLAETGLPAAVVLEVLRRFDQTILMVCEGQFLDISYEGNLTIDEGDYLAMIGRKTAALIAAATGLGAIVGHANPQSTSALFTFGQNLGLAFQVQDDILGIWGEPAVTGKPRAADLYQRKLTLPVILGLRQAEQHTELAQLYSQEELSDADVEQVLTILDESGARGYSEGVAAHYHQVALKALDQVQIPKNATTEAEEALQQLKNIANRLLGRDT